MVAHNVDFSRGIAMVLQGESLKAQCYVTHSASLGVLREKMVSRFVRHETPDRFRVETGLIRNHQLGATSRQCDLLVHEPKDIPPLYRWEDFVVVHHTAARAVVEVKSNLDKEDFKRLLDIHTSVVQMELSGSGAGSIPSFAYSLSGVSFETFVEYLHEALVANPLEAEATQRHLNLPVCIAVQDKSYLGLRPLRRMTNQSYCFCAVDLTRTVEQKDEGLTGIETGIFLQVYGGVLREKRDALIDGVLYDWFNKLPVSPEGKVWLTPEGVANYGDIPFEYDPKSSDG